MTTPLSFVKVLTGALLGVPICKSWLRTGYWDLASWPNGVASSGMEMAMCLWPAKVTPATAESGSQICRDLLGKDLLLLRMLFDLENRPRTWTSSSCSGGGGGGGVVVGMELAGGGG